MQEQIHNVTTYNGIIGALLRRRREQLGLEQGTISQKIGLTQSSYSRIESGKTSLTLAQLSAISPHYSVRPADFIDQVEQVKMNMKRQGIDVVEEPTTKVASGVTNILIGAALLAVVAQLIKK